MRAALVSGVLAILTMPAAHAAAYSESASWIFSGDGADSYPVLMRPFDTSLGTLTAIDATLSGSVQPFMFADALYAPGSVLPASLTWTIDASVLVFPTIATLEETVILPLSGGAYAWPLGPISFGMASGIPLAAYNAILAAGSWPALAAFGGGNPDVTVINSVDAGTSEISAAATLTYTYNPVPEPPAVTTFALGLIGLAMAWTVRQRR